MEVEEKYHATDHVIMRLHERLGITPIKEAAETFFYYQLSSMSEIVEGNEADKNEGKIHLSNGKYEFIVGMSDNAIITFLDHSYDNLSDNVILPLRVEHARLNEGFMNKTKDIESELQKMYEMTKLVGTSEFKLEELFEKIDDLEMALQVINDERRFNNYRFHQYIKYIKEFKLIRQ